MITKETLEELYVKKQLTQKEVADLLGVTHRTIGNYLKRFEIPIRTRGEAYKLKRKDNWGVSIEQISPLIAKGLLVQEIAAHFNVHRRVIGTLLKENGINLRNNPSQRKRQSAFMTIHNPVPKGSCRGREALEPALQAYRAKFKERVANVTSFKQYAQITRSLAREYWLKKHPKYTAEGLVVDHMFSVKDGFDAGVPVLVISHPKNIRLITAQENASKGAKSILTFDEFCELVDWHFE